MNNVRIEYSNSFFNSPRKNKKKDKDEEYFEIRKPIEGDFKVGDYVQVIKGGTPKDKGKFGILSVARGGTKPDMITFISKTGEEEDFGEFACKYEFRPADKCPACNRLYPAEEIINYKGKKLCPKCVKKIKAEEVRMAKKVAKQTLKEYLESYDVPLNEGLKDSLFIAKTKVKNLFKDFVTQGDDLYNQWLNNNGEAFKEAEKSYNLLGWATDHKTILLKLAEQLKNTSDYQRILKFRKDLDFEEVLNHLFGSAIVNKISDIILSKNRETARKNIIKAYKDIKKSWMKAGGPRASVQDVIEPAKSIFADYAAKTRKEAENFLNFVVNDVILRKRIKEFLVHYKKSLD